jgi:pimeloyl-ACP methyl ester carboxylesterase
MTEPAVTKISVRGCNIALRRAGAGRPLLYLHGASDAGLWLPFMDELAARHDVIVPEHPGFGASDTPAWLDTIADLANFYLDLIDQLDLDDIDLVGHDLGGWIAAELAVRNPRRLASLALMGAYGIQVPDVMQIDLFLRTDERRMRDQFHDPAKADDMIARVLRPELEDINLKNQTTTARLTWQPRGYDPHLAKWLHRITLPTLLFWGEDDKVLPLAYGRAWQKLISGAQLITLPGGGHLLHIEQPLSTCTVVESFLRRTRVPA